MKYIKLLNITAFLLFGYVGYPADNPTELTLNECINTAIQNNPAIKVSAEDLKKALADYKVARAQRLLFIEFNAKTETYTKTNVPTTYTKGYELAALTPSPYNYVGKYLLDQKQPQPPPFVDTLTRDYDLGITTGVMASISLYNEKKAKTQSAAKSTVGFSKIQAKKTMLDVILNVKRAYYTYFMAKENVSLREKLLKSNQDRLKMTEILYKNAQRQILDLSRAKYDLEEAKLELTKSKNNERLTRIDLFYSMGMEDKGAQFVVQDYQVLPELKYSLEQLLKFGELNYPDLQLIQKQKEINKIKIDIEKGGYYPDVDFQFGGGYRNAKIDFTSSKKNFEPGSWKPTVAVNFIARLPIFSSGAVSGKVSSATAEYNKLIYKEKDTVMSMKTTIESNYTSLQEIKKQLEMSKLMKENSEKHLLLAKKTYESGVGTQLDLHDAMVSLINAELGYRKTKFDYLMTIAKLSSIVGLGEDSLCKK